MPVAYPVFVLLMNAVLKTFNTQYTRRVSSTVPVQLCNNFNYYLYTKKLQYVFILTIINI